MNATTATMRIIYMAYKNKPFQCPATCMYPSMGFEYRSPFVRRAFELQALTVLNITSVFIGAWRARENEISQQGYCSHAWSVVRASICRWSCSSEQVFQRTPVQEAYETPLYLIVIVCRYLPDARRQSDAVFCRPVLCGNLRGETDRKAASLAGEGI